jgi:glycosyltransferase involved in cell wall biosynthesis
VQCINGIVVQQGDEHALAEAILQLLRDPQLRGKLVENMRILADKLKWSSVARRWLEVFQ